MSTRTSKGARIIRFDHFELDSRAGELRRDGEAIRLQEQPLRILLMLLERPGEVVLRDEIRTRLWPNGTVVEMSHGINAAVLRLREALGESAGNPRLIETVARRGYRFRADMAAPPAPVSPRARYQLHEQIGAGGMGVVYRAEDLQLGRQVALKLLPRELAADAVALGRFHREARAASALTHPNICTIYGVEEHEGQPAIAMELLHGETLEALLARGPLPVARALEIALPIASALAAAHRKGVAHRDLKPANILIAPDGLKVLDFGLAKMDRPSLFEMHVTERGAILGTLHYMSPEQVQGKDARIESDIFSFGVVLYEMLAGRRPFDGENSAIVMASILKSEPTPLDHPGLWRIVARCLAKDPADRWQSVADLKAALECPPALPATRSRRKVPVVPILAAVAVLAALILFLSRDRSAPFSRSTIQANAMRLSLSPDGKRIAYYANARLYIRALDQQEPRPLEGSEGPPTTPFWSPDGRSLAFASRGVLKVVSAAAGVPRLLAPVNTNVAGAWGRDGTILIGVIGDGIFRIPSAGGMLTRVTTLEGTETRHLLPQFLPDGHRFLFLAASSRPGESMLYAASLDAPGRTPILQLDSNAQQVGSRLVYARGGTLFAQAFDAATLRLSSDAIPIASSLASIPTVGAAARVVEFSITPMTLAYKTPASAGFITLERNWTTLLTR
jgi:serine/threonine protein kinase